MPVERRVRDDLMRKPGTRTCTRTDFPAIESRVARIKARVAELTGGVGEGNVPQAVPKVR